MSRYFLGLMILLAAGALFTGCGDSEAETSMAPGDSPVVTIIDNQEVHGWVEIALSDAPPAEACSGEGCTWLLFDAGNLLRFDSADGGWSYYCIEDISAGEILDFSVSGDCPVLLTSSSLMTFDPATGEVLSEDLPDGFDPVLIGSAGTTIAMVDEDGDLALRGEEGFDVHEAPETLSPIGQLVTAGPDWVFMLEEGGIAFYDPAVGLWQLEEAPLAEVLVALDGEIFLGTSGEIVQRTSPSTWETVAEARLYAGGLMLTEQDVRIVSDPDEVLSVRPSFQPAILVGSAGNSEPYWAIDELGLTAYAELGTVDPSLSFYEAERVSCSLAGQSASGMGSSASVEDMITSASGAFRIYESVSTRPDPFSEFSMESRDIRRTIEDISIEELRLVGIILDPVGGDQALVEDRNNVPYVLYEGTELKNNTHVAEITSVEVIVIQDVIVDYTATGGGVTTIPTIYSMRLQEEGGL